MDGNGEIYDPLQGRRDLDARIIRVIGNVEEKLSEDPLRCLRAIRLSIVYDFKIEDSAYEFIMNNPSLLKSISYTRRKYSISKILLCSNARIGLDMLKSAGLLEFLEIDFKDDYKPVKDLIGAWAQLKFSENYPFTKVEKSRLKGIREILASGKVDALTIFTYGLYDALIAGEIMGIDNAYIQRIYDEMSIHKDGELALSSETIKMLTDTPLAKKIKEIKKDLISEILSGNLPNSDGYISEYILKKWK